MRRALLAALCALGALAVPVQSARAQQPVPGQPVVIDGPSPDILRPAAMSMSIARDGTGGVVYLKQVAGVSHVFVSALSGGTFHAPVQLDAGLGASSQPVIAAGNGGLVLVAFVSGGELYVADSAGAARFGNPIPLAGGGINPSISITDVGKAYLAFTAPDGGGDDVRAAYYYNGSWGVASAPLNVTPADDAGTGSGRPQVAAAGDGVGIVVWGEAGHVYSRRVRATSPSVVDEQADAPLPGCSEVSADEPVVGAEGNSSYADVAFHELLTCGSGASTPRSRVLMNRLHGSLYDGITQPDGLAASTADGADDPQIAMGEYGLGWVTSSRASSNDLIATAFGDDGVSQGTTKVNGTAATTPTYGTPATAGVYSTLIAWQQDPGSSGAPEIRFRYAPNGGTLGPEIVASSSAQGPTDAASGLAAGGDLAGDAAIAWVQGAAGATQIMAALLYQPPSGFGPAGVPRFVTTAQPLLAWTQSRERWGPVTYTVTVDGSQVAQTQATSLPLPVALSNGPHTWAVTATNPAGQSAQMSPATVFVDTVAPTAQLTLSGTMLIGKQLQAVLAYGDAPPPGEPAADASGVASAVIDWGDGTVAQLQLGAHRSFHTYASPGAYAITATVTDNAGNQVATVLHATILKPKPKPKKRHKPAPRRRA